MYNSRIFCVSLLAMVFVIGIIFHTAQAQPISLTSSNEIYYMGDHIVISGNVETIFETMPVTIQIYQGSDLVDVAQVPVATDGTFAASFTAEGQQWKNEGTYSARAFYTQTITSEITFEFFNQIIDESHAVFPVQIPNSGTFDVGYTIRGGEVKDIEMDSERYSIIIETTMDSNGNLILKLPRESFDSQSDGVDETFIILVSKENSYSENTEQIVYEEIATGPDYRNIRIPLEEGDKWVEVIGTYVIPEFGSIVMMILLVGIISTIIITKSRLAVRYN